MVFRDVSFHVRAGEALAVEGPNGSGKTSLLRMIAGFFAPETGSIVLSHNGAEIADGEERAKHIGWLGHQDGIKPQMTPAETLHFFAQLHALPLKAGAAIESLLAEVGIARTRDLPCRYLSAGQKKRLALARLQLSARPLWLLDEPLAALDTQGKALLRMLIERHCARGGIVIAATHEPLGFDCAILTLT